MFPEALAPSVHGVTHCGPTSNQHSDMSLHTFQLLIHSNRPPPSHRQLSLHLSKIGSDLGKPPLTAFTVTCNLVHQHCPHGCGIPHPLLHLPIWILTLSPTVETPLQEAPLVRRNLQPSELMTAHTTGRLNQIFVIKILKHRCGSLRIRSFKEGPHQRIQRMDI